MAQPPLYSVKRGKEVEWLYTDKDLDEWKAKNGIKDEEIAAELDKPEGEEEPEVIKKGKQDEEGEEAPAEAPAEGGEKEG